MPDEPGHIETEEERKERILQKALALVETFATPTPTADEAKTEVDGRLQKALRLAESFAKPTPTPTPTVTPTLPRRELPAFGSRAEMEVALRGGPPTMPMVVRGDPLPPPPSLVATPTPIRKEAGQFDPEVLMEGPRPPTPVAPSAPTRELPSIGSLAELRQGVLGGDKPMALQRRPGVGDVGVGAVLGAPFEFAHQIGELGAGGVRLGVGETQRLLGNEDAVSRLFRHFRSQGYGPAVALQKAHEAVDMPWGVKGLMEEAFDPTAWVGLGLAGKGAQLARGLLKGGRAVGTGIGRGVGRGVGRTAEDVVQSRTGAGVAGRRAVIDEPTVPSMQRQQAAERLTGPRAAVGEAPTRVTPAAVDEAAVPSMQRQAAVARLMERAGTKGAERGMPPIPHIDRFRGRVRAPTPTELLLDPRSFDEQIEIAFEPTRARRISEWLANIPIVSTAIRLANPSAVAKSPMGRAAIGRAQLQDDGARSVNRALAHAQEIGAQDDLFGPTNPLTGLLRRGHLAGHSVNEIAENPSRFQLTEQELEWFARMGDIEEASYRLLKRNGVDIGKIPIGEVERYAGRVMVAKLTPEDELVEVAFIGASRARRLGRKTSQEKARTFETVKEAQDAGYVVMPYEQAVAIKTQAAMNRVINKRTADHILKNLPEGTVVRTTATPEKFVLAAREAQRGAQAVLDVIDSVQRALRGEGLPGATLRSIRHHTPDLGAELDRAVALTPTEFTTAINRLSREIQQATGITAQALRGALDQARLAAGKGARLGARDITPGELTAALRILGKDQRLSNRMLTEIYKNAFTFRNAERSAALREVLRKAREALPAAKNKAKIAVNQRASARARAREPHFREGYKEVPLDVPGLEQRFLSGPGVQQFTADFDQMMSSPSVNSFFKAVSSLNAVQRIFALAGDASPFMIQFIAALYRHPKAMFHSANAFTDALVKAIFSPAAARRAAAKRINDNKELLNRHSGVILSSSGNEFTEALSRGGLLGSKNLFAEGLTFGERLKAIPGTLATPLRPFQQAFEAAMDEAGINILKGLEHLGKGDPIRMNAIDDYVNTMRGLSSSARLGVPPNQRMVESAFLLAPRYRRAIAALHASAIQGGLRGDLARRAYGSLALGLFSTYTGITIALGVKDGKSKAQIQDELKHGLNPTDSRFLLWRIGGQLVGPGSKIISDLRLLGKMAGTVRDPLGDRSLLDFEEFQDNPGVRWVRGQLAGVPGTAWDVFTGEYYMGEPIKLSDPSTLGRALGSWAVPMWMQSVLFEGGTLEGRAVRGAGEFFGLRSFPQGAIDILIDQSWNLLEVPYDELNGFEKTLLRETLTNKLMPLQKEQVEQGRELAKFFDEMDGIEDERRKRLLNLEAEGYDWMKYKSIEDRAAGRRFQAGIDQEFEEGDPEDPDPLKAALAQRNRLFANPNLRNDAGELLDEFKVELANLELSWSREQREHIARETNKRPIPLSILMRLPEKMRIDYAASQEARERYLTNVRGRPDLARISRRLFSLKNTK